MLARAPREWAGGADTDRESTMRIGELADTLGINPRTIRFYEARGLLPEPERTASGYRSYGQEDVERLTFIKTAQRIGLSLDEIAEIIALRDRGQPPCGYVRELIHRQVVELDRQIKEMRRLRQSLVQLRDETVANGDLDASYCCLIEHVRHKRPGAEAEGNGAG
ncbi:MAG: heavy metal-responsive transcriptional regulator [Acidimicrobiales bacterium]